MFSLQTATTEHPSGSAQFVFINTDRLILNLVVAIAHGCSRSRLESQENCFFLAFFSHHTMYNSRTDYGRNQVKPWPAGQKYETLHSYSLDTTEQFQKGSLKIVINSLGENHGLRNHGNAQNMNQ